MKKLFIATLLCLSVNVWGQNIPEDSWAKVESPDGKYLFEFYQKKVDEDKGKLHYTIHFDGKPVVLESDLGVLIENNLFESALAITNDTSELWSENLYVTGIDHSTIDETWNPVYGERNEVRNDYKKLVIHLEKYGDHEVGEEEGHAGTAYDRRRTYKMDIEVRAFNEGVAFRYHFPETKNGLFLHIVGEETSFTMPEGTMTWYERWAQGPYQYLPLKDWPDESERPLTMKLGNGLTVSLLEANMVDYSRGKFKLSEDKDNTLEISLYTKIDVITPYSTPWRVVMAAEQPGELLENNDIVLNLNTPNQIQNTSWIKPGKVIRSGLSTKEAKACIDFADERNLQYVHLDAGWYGPEMKVSSDATTISEERDLEMQKLINYAAKKDIGIIVYVNQRALANQLDEILPLYQDWGIKGIKFGFVQIGSNRWTVWMHNAIKKAAEYQIMVNVHDEYRPTGFSRTYQNLMTQEGIRGNEEMPDATHNTILPFTRYLAGAGDYTICYYSNRIQTTHAHQLALSVVYYSPLQYLYWYDNPGHYQGEKEIAFFDAVKTIWDDTKVLNGQPGEYITVARRSGDEWFVGAITNNEARAIEIPCSFLEPDKKYTAIIYYDDEKLNSRTKVNIKTEKVDTSGKLTFDLQASGGVAIQLKKE